MQEQTRLRPKRGMGDRFAVRLVVALGVALGFFLTALPNCPPSALEFTKGDISATLDTTITVGASFRTEDRDPDLIAISNGGNAYSNNMDNGDLNYNPGDLVSASARVTHELDARWRNFGFFGRMYYFYDWAVMQIPTERTPLTQSAKQYAGSNIKVLDAYLTGDFHLWDRPLTLRVGNQLLNWGESTFIQNGISVINPVDVSQLRVAGAELRDALLPVPMVSLNANLTDNLSLEGFYQFYWEKTDVEPEGTFFSTSDIGGPGGRQAFLGFGLPPVKDYPATPVGGKAPVGGSIIRDVDHDPSNQGQGGAAIRLFLPDLKDIELGVFYVHYHSRLPLVSFRTGAPPPPYPADPTSIVDWLSHTDLIVYGLLNGDYASTARFYREYPEHIHMVGASFNASLDFVGVAIQGECNFKSGQPLQLHSPEIVFASLSPIDPWLNALLTFESVLGLGATPPQLPYFGRSQLGAQPFFSEVQGWRRKDIIQPQMTLTKIFGPMLGWDQLAVVAEGGATYVLNMYDEIGADGKPMRYEAPGTFRIGNPWYEENFLNGVFNDYVPTQPNGFATDLSWGYRLALRADFNNAIGPINLQPSVSFAHDVEGTTPTPISNFVEDRKAVTATLTMNYLNRIRGSVSYTNYFDAGQFNLLHDRDFASVAASYSF